MKFFILFNGQEDISFCSMDRKAFVVIEWDANRLVPGQACKCQDLLTLYIIQTGAIYQGSLAGLRHINCFDVNSHCCYKYVQFVDCKWLFSSHHHSFVISLLLSEGMILISLICNTVTVIGNVNSQNYHINCFITICLKSSSKSI